MEDADGTRLTNVEHGHEIRLRVELEIVRDVPGLGVGFIVANADGVGVFQFGTGIEQGRRIGARWPPANASRSAPRWRTCWRRDATSSTAA